MEITRRLITLDVNIFIAALKQDEPYSQNSVSILDKIIHPMLLINVDKEFCASVYSLCHEYKIYSIDAIYLAVALKRGAILTSLDKEDFTDKVKAKNPPIEVYHASDFPY